MFPSNIFRSIVALKNCPRALLGTKYSSLAPAATQELDKLYKTIVVEVRSHDRAVLNSYEFFTKTAANELDINIADIYEPARHHERRTLLKSVHIYKKHRVQYEFRTYFRVFKFKYLTGSTADTFLEYIQRNLPEGVAMKVTKHRIERIPDSVLHLANEETNKPEENTENKN